MSSVKIKSSCNAAGDSCDGPIPGAPFALDISGYALLMLGSALCVQSVLSLWILARIMILSPNVVKTFSSNPVVVAIYMLMSRRRASSPIPMVELEVPEEHLYQPSTVALSGSEAIVPKPKPILYAARRQVKRVRILIRVLWSGFAGLGLGSILALIFAAKAGTLEKDAYGNRVWQWFGYNEVIVGWSSAVTDWAGGKYLPCAKITANRSRAPHSVSYARLSCSPNALRRCHNRIPQRRGKLAIFDVRMGSSRGHLDPKKILDPLA